MVSRPGVRNANAVEPAAAAERQLREIVESVNVVVWEADARTLRCSYVSPQAEAMFG
jgi:PAS domain-containing protein